MAPWLDAAWIEHVGQGMPIVTVALHGAAEHFDTVVDDERLGARLVVDHLVALGPPPDRAHQHAASGDWDGDFVLSHTARRDGFEQAMRDHSLEPDIIETWYSEEGGYHAAVQAFGRATPQRRSSPARTSPRSACCVPPRSTACAFPRT